MVHGGVLPMVSENLGLKYKNFLGKSVEILKPSHQKNKNKKNKKTIKSVYSYSGS